MRSRLGWSLFDQALSSGSNFGLSVLVARASSTADFGAFTIGFTTYLLCVLAERALAGEPLTIRMSAADPAELRQAAGRAAAAGVSLGVVTGVIVAAVALALDGPVRTTLLVVAALLPGLLLQDVWRHVFFARAEPKAAFLNDLFWAVAMAVGLVGLLATGTTGVGWFVAVWGGAGALAGLVGIAQSGVMPDWRVPIRWITTNRDLGLPFLAESGLDRGTSQATLILIAALSDVAVVGELNAARLLLGPLNLLLLGAPLYAIPEASRLRRQDPARLRLLFWGLVGVLGGAPLVTGVFVGLLLPDRLGRELLGESWEPAVDLLLPWITAFVVCAGLIVTARIFLRALEQARPALVARITTAPVLLVAAAVGVLAGGSEGAAAGFFVSNALGATLWLAMLRAAMRREAGARATG